MSTRSTRSASRPAAVSRTVSSSRPSRTAATSCASVWPPLAGISRSSPAATPATRSFTAPQSDMTNPSNPHSSRSTVVRSQGSSRGVHAVDPVVGAHDRPRVGGLGRPAGTRAGRSPAAAARRRRRSPAAGRSPGCSRRSASATRRHPGSAGRGPAPHPARPLTSGSSDRYSKLRPHSGERLMLIPGPSSTPTPSACASSPSAAPTRSTSAASQVDPRVTAGGKHVAGTLSFSPRWSPVVACFRTPCGPSVSMIDGTPGAAVVSQNPAPLVSDAFSSRVRAATTASVSLGGSGSRHRRERACAESITDRQRRGTAVLPWPHDQRRR